MRNTQKTLKKEIKLQYSHRLTDLEQEVHVWCIVLSQYSESIAVLKSILSEQELRKCNHFKNRCDKDKCIIRYGLLRNILSTYLNIYPKKIKLNLKKYEKPSILFDNRNIDMRFNMAYSMNRVIYAITLKRNIGVDIERIEDEINIDEIISNYYTKNEKDKIYKHLPKERPYEFFKIWTIKEALLKAFGLGISDQIAKLDTIDIEKNKNVTKYSEKISKYNKNLVIKQFNFDNKYVSTVVCETEDLSVQIRKITYPLTFLLREKIR